MRAAHTLLQPRPPALPLDYDAEEHPTLSAARVRALSHGRAGGRAVAHVAGGRPMAAPTLVAHTESASTQHPAAEPTLGITSDGTLFFVGLSGQSSLVLRSKDNGAHWDGVDPLIPGTHADELTFDPFLYVDKLTDRLWNADLTLPNCAGISWSDDRGDTFSAGTPNCHHTDHQNLFAGPPPPGGTAPTGYPNVVYYCSNDGGATLEALATGCSKSLDGGLTWLRSGAPAFTNDPSRSGGSFGIPGFCSGATGHGKAAKSGTIYLPRGWCDQPYLGISKDEGLTWTRVQVSDKGMMTGIEDEVIGTDAGLAVEDHEASVAIDPAGNVFYMWIARDRLPYVAVSRDGGAHFDRAMMVAAPGVNEAWAPAIDAGDTGRIVFTYIGTTNSPGGPFCVRTTGPTTCATADGRPEQPKSAYANTTWNGYMSMSVDALAAEPHFETATVNDPADPLVQGAGCGPVRCLAELDFLDVVVSRDGTAWGSFVDACEGVDGCGSSGVGIVGHLLGGQPLVGTLREQMPTVPRPSKKCTRAKKTTVRVRGPKRGKLRSVRITVGGKKLKVRRRGRDALATLDLRRSSGKTVTVRIDARTTTGRRIRKTLRYRVCI
jgi:hypothetical protein